jgi:hypothetical protein
MRRGRHSGKINFAYRLVGVASLHAINFLSTFKEYPPSQLPATFSVDGYEDQLNQEIEKTLKPPAPVSGAK